MARTPSDADPNRVAARRRIEATKLAVSGAPPSAKGTSSRGNIVRPSETQPTSSRLQRIETVLAAEAAAREKAEKLLAEVQSSARDLQTKIGHAELARNEAVETARRERESLQKLLKERDALQAQLKRRGAARRRTVNGGERTESTKTHTVTRIRDRAQVISYSKIVIAALTEALDYDPIRRHNQPPPELWLEDPAYLAEIRELVAQLQRLNDLLSESRPSEKTSGAVTELAKCSKVFLKHYVPVVAKGAGYLTVAALGGLLFQAGISGSEVREILSLVKLIR